MDTLSHQLHCFSTYSDGGYITRTKSDLQGYKDVSQGLAIGVMAVHCQCTDWHLSAHRLQHLTYATWSPHSDSVTERDLIAAHGIQTLSYLQDERQSLRRLCECLCFCIFTR